MPLAFDASLSLPLQVEVVEKEDEIQVIAHTNNWWSAGVNLGLKVVGAGLFGGALIWLMAWMSAHNGQLYFSLGFFGGALVLGGTLFRKSTALSQNRLEVTLEEDFFKVEQATFIFQESQKYLYEDIVAIYGVPEFKIITKKEQYTRIWGRKLLPQQLKYLAQALAPIWRVPGKKTGEEEDWSEHLVD